MGMIMDARYSWSSFFMVFADKLLAFKDDRQALIVTFQRIYAELGMDLPTLDSGDSHDVGLAVNVIGRISS